MPSPAPNHAPAGDVATRRPRSLRARMLMSLCIYGAMLCGLGSLTLSEFLQARLTERLQSRASTLAASIEVASDTSRARGELQDFVAALAGTPDIREVLVLDSQQQVVASTNRAWLGASYSVMKYWKESAGLCELIRPDTELPVFQSGTAGLCLTQPLRTRHDGESTATPGSTGALAVVLLDTRGVRAESIAGVLLLVLAMCVVTAFFLAALYIDFRKLVTLRLQAIESVLHGWREGRHDLRAEPGEADEIGALASGLNETLEAIQRTQAQLARSEAELRRMVDSSIDCLISMDAEGRVQRWNPQAERTFGWTSAEIVGKPLVEHLVPAHLRAAHIDGLRRFGATGQGSILGKRIEVTAIDKSGSEFPVEVTVHPLEVDGQWTFHAFLRDLRDRDQAQHAREESDLRFELALEGSNDGFWDWRKVHSDEQWWSPKFYELLGYQPGELPSSWTSFKSLVHEEDSDLLVARMEDHFAGLTLLDHELRLRCKDGAWRWFRFRGQAVTNELGVLSRMAGSLSDVDERRRTQEELRDHAAQLQQAKSAVERTAADLVRSMKELGESKKKAEDSTRSKSEFLANMSHEIRTPMTSIMGFADLLLDPATPPEERRSHLHTIRRNGEHLLTLINDILDLSKVEAGRVELEQVEFSPVDVLDDVRALVKAKLQEKRLVLGIDFETPIPRRVRSDPMRLRQILVNLVGNAIKFTEVGGIRVVAGFAAGRDPRSGRLHVRVEDTGIGMTEEQIGRLFQPFVQADTSTTRRFGGTGLGLTIARRLAQRMGGDIAVESRPGQGSSFTLEVEVALAPGVELHDPRQERRLASLQPAPALPIARASDLDGLRILLAEDGRDNQRLITLVLERAGARIVTAENGRIACDKALEALRVGTPYDLILMDMQMPELDGWSATALLRSVQYDGPIIALTANAMEGDRERCLAAGCDDFASKPIDKQKLLAAIERWRGRKSEYAARAAGRTTRS